MKSVWVVLVAALLADPAAGQTAGTAGVVPEVRAAIGAQDLDRADAIFAKARADHGTTPEVIEALSWLSRGALAEEQWDRADRYAREAQQLAVSALGGRRLDSQPRLATALGAGIEVEAHVRAQRGERSDAIYFLRRHLDTYGDTSIHKRIQKNINLLSLGRAAGASA